MYTKFSSSFKSLFAINSWFCALICSKWLINVSRTEVEGYDADIEQRVVNNEQLRTKVNDLTGTSLHLQVTRLEMEDQVGVDQACSDKGEQDFKVAQEAKQFQDKYIGKSLKTTLI